MNSLMATSKREGSLCELAKKFLAKFKAGNASIFKLLAPEDKASSYRMDQENKTQPIRKLCIGKHTKVEMISTLLRMS